MLGLPKKTRFGMVDWRAIAEEVKPIADRVGVKASLAASVKGLSTAENWLINIARALVRKSRLIVMDEPTAALSAAESERLFAHRARLAQVRRRGALRLPPARRGSRPLPARHGVPRRAVRLGTRRADADAFLAGRRDRRRRPRSRAEAQQPPQRAAQSSCPLARLRRAPKVIDASFDLHAGEVLGLGGLVGAGRTELARLVFGADRRGRRRDAAGRTTLCAEESRRSGQGGHRLRARGAPRRGSHSDEERRLQSEPGKSRFADCLARLALHQQQPRAAASRSGSFATLR